MIMAIGQVWTTGLCVDSFQVFPSLFRLGSSIRIPATWPQWDFWGKCRGRKQIWSQYSLSTTPEGHKAKQNHTRIMAGQQSWEIEPSRAAGQE